MSQRATKISELSCGVIFELCKHLDQPSQRNWKALLAKAPGTVYTSFDVSAFEREGNHRGSSATEAVIKDFITRGYTVDDLFLMLNAIEHVEGMRVIRNHVSSKVKEVLDCTSNVNVSTGQKEELVASPNSTHFDLHPDYGPLPPPLSPSGDYHHHHHHHHHQHQLGTWAQGNFDPSHHHPRNVGGAHNHVPKPEEVGQSQPYRYEDLYPQVAIAMAPTAGPELSDVRLVEQCTVTPATPTSATTTSATPPPPPATSPSPWLAVHPIATRVKAPPTCLPLSYPPGYPQSDAPLNRVMSADCAQHVCHAHQPQPCYQGVPQRPLLQYPPPPASPHPPYQQAIPSQYSNPGPPQGNFPHSLCAQSSSSSSSSSSLSLYHVHQGSLSSTPPSFGSAHSSFGFYSLSPPPSTAVLTSFQPAAPSRVHSFSSAENSPTSFPPQAFKNPPSPATSGGDSPQGQTSLLPSLDPHPPPPHPTLSALVFSYSELSDSTGNFTECLVGQGSFGSVFVAKVRGNGPYAIKKLHSESEMEGGSFFESFHRSSFTQEVQVLSKYHHRNILSLVAYSADGPRPCLVYEYMKNGSLADCLLGKRNISLLWNLRVNIGVEIATALNFLHTINKPKSLIHGDVKSTNILLDDHCVPKLSDFGLARELQAKPNQRSSYSTQSNVVMGTLAYMAPEFLRNRKMTTKTDVYSFGVVLLELFTGLAADDPTLKQRTLTVRLEDLFGDTEGNRGRILHEGDHRARWPEDIGIGLFDIATICLSQKAKERPDMDQVLTQLEHLCEEGKTL